MSPKGKSRWWVLLPGIALVLAGFFRDFIFVNINYRMRILYGWDEYGPMPTLLQSLESWDYVDLYYLKWVLTGVATLLFFGLTWWGIYLWFRDKKLITWTAGTFGAIILLSGLFFLGGKLTGQEENGYMLSRKFMEFVQSPLLFMILIPGFNLLKRATPAEEAK